MVQSRIVTANGPISPDELGPALLHEHILIDLGPMVGNGPADPEARRLFELPLSLENLAEIKWSRDGMLSRANIDMSDPVEAIEELRHFARAGGSAVVDVTPIGLRRDVAQVAEIGRAAGVHVVVGSAFFVEPLIPAAYAAMSADDLARVIIDEFDNGIEASGIHPGVIGEVGTSSPVSPREEEILRASATAAAATGMSIIVHLDPWATEGARVIDILEAAGADLTRVVVGHLNPTLPDVDYHASLAERGVVLGYDLCGYEIVLTPGRYPPRDWETADAVARLVRAGFGAQIILSQDTSLKTDYVKYGGWGYAHILLRVLPLLRERGLDEARITTITTDTPRRLLTLV